MIHKPEIATRHAFVILLILLAAQCGCGSMFPPIQSVGSKLFIVADTNNNRVLIYDAPLTTAQSANVVLGQSSLTASASGSSAAEMNTPTAVTVDASGNLYVADTGNCRVLQFQPPFTTGMSAAMVFGQTSTGSSACLSSTATATGLGSGIGGIAIDSGGNLWVTDSAYSRILEYPAPFTAGEAATVALGQFSLTSAYGVSGCNQGGAIVSANTLCFPGGGLAFDSSGNLWAADNGNNRVLMYPVGDLITGGAATVELGQPATTAFSSNSANTGGVSASSLYLEFFRMDGIAFDSSGNLWVSDINNHRVLMYPKAILGNNGAAATVELGQPSATAFLSNSANNPALGANSLNFPIGLAFDRNGNLAVGDSANGRTLLFTPPFTNGMNAGVVLGQANFTTAVFGAATATSQDAPYGIATAP